MANTISATNSLVDQEMLKQGQNPFGGFESKSNDQLSQFLQLAQQSLGNVQKQTSYSDILQQTRQAAGVPDLQKQYTDINQKLLDLQQNYNTALGKIQQTPSLTGFQEAARQNALSRAANPQIGQLEAQRSSLGTQLGFAQQYAGQATAAGEKDLERQYKLSQLPLDFLSKAFGLQKEQAQTGYYQARGNLADIQAQQGKQPTSNIQEYNLAKEQGYKGSFLNFLGSKKQETTINIGGDIGTITPSTTSSGLQYVDGTQFSGKDKQAAERQARQLGVPILSKDDKEVLQNVENARYNQQDILDQVNGLLPKDAQGRIIEAPLNKIKKYLQTNDQLAAFNSFRTAAINTLRATAGSKGLRINQAEINQAIQNDIPQITDTIGVARQKVKNIGILLNNAERATLGYKGKVNQNSHTIGNIVTGGDGKRYKVNAKGNYELVQ